MHWASLFAAFAQVVLIDITLASDNAIVLGMGAAVVLLCGLAFFAVELLRIGGPGLVLAGGLLLLLICWQLWKDLRAKSRGEGHGDAAPKHRTLLAVLIQIFI